MAVCVCNLLCKTRARAFYQMVVHSFAVLAKLPDIVHVRFSWDVEQQCMILLFLGSLEEAKYLISAEIYSKPIW